ncbi:hypothetical protein N5079_28350 [Planotetraspora sp. A-T 1434]|uniref:hypothetical protein n=1 Tax=Planotetraspora sp. A-T 1434 TaxID=2979219 RepID=UPI0021C1D108|nr:hypothetical protein [Planotetraspora sp. A-T 1434]MCT9934126.1 hypothetical protein [Planotetraspora sp. A-T 1434]
MAKIAIPAATVLLFLYLATFTIMLVRSSALQEALRGPVICEFIPDAPPSQQEKMRDLLGCDTTFVLVLFAGVAMIGLLPLLAMTYLSVQVLRFRADLLGTVLVIQGAMRAKRLDLSSAQVRIDATGVRRIPCLQIFEPPSSSGRLYLRDFRTPLMPPDDLLAIAHAIEAGIRPEPFADQATQTAVTLRRLATDPLTRLIA